MSSQLGNLSIKEKIFLFNYVNDDLQIICKDGKYYLYDIPVDSILKEINVEWINKEHSILLKDSDKSILRQILSNYEKFKGV